MNILIYRKVVVIVVVVLVVAVVRFVYFILLFYCEENEDRNRNCCCVWFKTILCSVIAFGGRWGNVDGQTDCHSLKNDEVLYEGYSFSSVAALSKKDKRLPSSSALSIPPLHI